MESTKRVDRIAVSEEIVQKLVLAKREEQLNKISGDIVKFTEQFYETVQPGRVVPLAHKPLYYVKLKEGHYLIPDPKKIQMYSGRLMRTIRVSDNEVYEGRKFTMSELMQVFANNRRENPLLEKIPDTSDFRVCALREGKLWGSAYVLVDVGSHSSDRDWYINKSTDQISTNSADSNTLYLPIIPLPEKVSALELFLKRGFIPMLSENNKEDKRVADLNALRKLYKSNGLIFSEEEKVPVLHGDVWKKFCAGKVTDVFGINPITRADVLSQPYKLKGEAKAELFQDLLQSDYRRAEIEPYPENILEDINAGHWELWSSHDADEERRMYITPGLEARNPLADIREDGIVGIDFGTKSTIVVYQNGSDTTLPMCVGSGKFKKELKYENPTVMEFLDINSFMQAYKSKAGRPETRWADITVSHKAAEQLKDGKDSSRYYSFFDDLKQWTGERNRKITIMDNSGHEEILPAFVDIKEDGLNPLEIYAYYLGLFINNMYNGIYLNYILSFPVTYEKEVREKILESFEKGIKKSLPEEVLKDAETMERFRVVQGASEPAAYAICALEQYGFAPEEGEKVFYGIFDFGGGTADFDFGIWRAAEWKECRRYDYVIEHFGEGGDRYLGGENLLELLAFHVFKNNKDALLAADIEFTRPEECKEFAGQQLLISNSQEAKLNMRQLMEKLRGFWQNDDKETIEEIASGAVKLLLFDKHGKLQPNFELKVNQEELRGILWSRIEKGVSNFFNALKLNFSKEYLRDVDGIHIFLAGNSSKSQIVRDLFKEYFEQKTAEILLEERVATDESADYFHIYPPLGTEEAKAIQKEKGIDCTEDITNPKPTGKTGVAFGLIEGRPGSRIKVVSEVKSSDEIKFKFYIGNNVKKCFHKVIDRELEYEKWYRFTDASEDIFELYYTSLPEATTNKLPITEESIAKKVCYTDVTDESANVYIRAKTPTTIEYVVAKPEEIKNEKYLGKIKQRVLE